MTTRKRLARASAAALALLMATGMAAAPAEAFDPSADPAQETVAGDDIQARS